MNKTITKPESRNSLISPGKSSRLDAIRKKSGRVSDQPAPASNSKKNQFPKNLNPQTNAALVAMNQRVEDYLNDVLRGYPANKKNSFFRLKHGCEIDQLREMNVQEICKCLKLDTTKIKDYALIAKLNLQGSRRDAE